MQVALWLCTLGLDDYISKFNTVTGAELMRMDEAAIHAKVRSQPSPLRDASAIVAKLAMMATGGQEQARPPTVNGRAGSHEALHHNDGGHTL